MQEQSRPAYLMPEFLNSTDGRPLRILSEYLEPLRRFRRHNIQDTVVFFGSARVLSAEAARGAVSALEESIGGTTATDTAEAALRRARRAQEWSRYYEEARRLAFRLTEWSRSLKSPRHRFVVCSGGGPGIMEAANLGAHEAGGPTVGLNIRLPFEQAGNPYITRGLSFHFHYFFMRKFWFAYLARAIVVFPGGFGTLDEMFEMLTLIQTNKLAKRIDVFLYGSEYWEPILNFEPLIEWGAVSRNDLALFTPVDDVDTAFEQLRARLEMNLVPAHPQENEAPGIAKTRDRER
jgi:uncharacterized protein (TIGR00730 family)